MTTDPAVARQLQLLQNNYTVFMRRASDPTYSPPEQLEARRQAEATQREISVLSR